MLSCDLHPSQIANWVGGLRPTKDFRVFSGVVKGISIFGGGYRCRKFSGGFSQIFGRLPKIGDSHKTTYFTSIGYK